MITNFCKIYQELHRDNLETLELIYHPDIHFVDPAHELRGLPALTAYFHGLYSNTSSVGFEFLSQLQQGNDVALEWLMRFSHPRLRSGRLIRVNGMSRLHLAESGLVDHHRDYFDLGALIYEQLPVIGSIVTTLKRRISK